MQVPYIEAELTKDQFSKFRRVFPVHELPIHMLKYGEDSLSVKEKTGDYLSIDNIDGEVERLIKTYGNETLKTVFGTNFMENIEFSINKIISKEKDVNGSKNKIKPKDRVSAETRV
jgi:hypothetical protein|tara:strand:- start:715 stop:1062 length:348 start_codon:yes stop_codon:yes gene_type:complete